jgi:cation transporter-like permease
MSRGIKAILAGTLVVIVGNLLAYGIKDFTGIDPDFWKFSIGWAAGAVTVFVGFDVAHDPRKERP